MQYYLGQFFAKIILEILACQVLQLLTAFSNLQGGRGLHTTLNTHSKKFIGILNGIDTDTWNPSTDSHIEVQYNANDLQGKAANKQALRTQLGLLHSDSLQPLVGAFT